MESYYRHLLGDYEDVISTTQSDYDGATDAYLQSSSWSSVGHYLTPLLFGAIFLFGVLGNGLVIFVIMCMRRGALRKVTNIYLVNLAAADLLVLIFCVPFTWVIYVMPRWPFGTFMCKAVDYLMLTSMATSIMTMTAMSIDRYCAVVGPNGITPYRTVRSTVVVLGVIWVVNAVLLSPILVVTNVVPVTYGWNSDNQVETYSYCINIFPSSQSQRAYVVSLFVGYYALPLCIISVSYLLMARNMWGNIGPGLPPACTLNAKRRHRHVCGMVLIMVVTFGICWLPVYVVQLYIEFSPNPIKDSDADRLHVVKVFGHCLSYINSALNPLIYSFMSHVFRQCCKEALAITCRGCNADSGLMHESPVAGPGTKGRMLHGGQRADRLRAREACVGDGEVIMPLKVTTSTDQNILDAPRNTPSI